jgi:hypothetical protein
MNGHVWLTIGKIEITVLGEMGMTATTSDLGCLRAGYARGAMSA